MRASLVSIALLSAAPLLAQTSYFTTPKGFALAEGNIEAFLTHPFYAAASRYQYLDGTQAPTAAKSLKGLELRRRASEVPGAYPARTTNLVLVLAHTVVAQATTTFTANYKGSPTTVYSGSFALPDFSQGPLAAPASWSVTIPYSSPFGFNGTDGLLVELQCQGTSPAGQRYPLDVVDGQYVPGGYGIYNGFEPCQVAGRVGPFLIYRNNDPVLAAGIAAYDMYAADGPASQAGAWILGLGQIYFDFSGALCAHLQPQPDLALPVVTSALGEIGTAGAPLRVSYPYPGVVHRVYAQFVALDPTQGALLKIALSDDIRYTVGDTGPYDVKRLSATGSSTAATGVLSPTYVPIMRHAY